MLWVGRGVVEPLDPTRLTSVFPNLDLDVAAEGGSDYKR